MKSERCKRGPTVLPDLLFDRAAAPHGAKVHLASCAACQEELAALEHAAGMLDRWQVPEPSPFWSARMGARLREEQAEGAHGGFLERMRTRLWLSNHRLRPVAGAAALGLALVAGGGAWLNLAGTQPAAPVQASNTVRDLQSLDENAQVFQQLSSLDGPPSGAQDSE